MWYNISVEEDLDNRRARRAVIATVQARRNKEAITVARIEYVGSGGGGGRRDPAVSLSAKGQNLLAFSAQFRALYGLSLHAHAKLLYDDDTHELVVVACEKQDPGAHRFNARGADANGGGLYVTARGALRYFGLVVEETCLLPFAVKQDNKGAWQEIVLTLRPGQVTHVEAGAPKSQS